MAAHLCDQGSLGGENKHEKVNKNKHKNKVQRFHSSHVYSHPNATIRASTCTYLAPWNLLPT